jgi:hypothetical protein
MLEYHTRFADRDTFAAIRAFFYEHNIGTVIATVNGILGADLHALTALCADPGLVYSRLREMRLDFQGGLFGIGFLKMTNSANLHTQTAPAALGRYYFDSFYFHDVLESLLHYLIYLPGNPDGGHQHY